MALLACRAPTGHRQSVPLDLLRPLAKLRDLDVNDIRLEPGHLAGLDNLKTLRGYWSNVEDVPPLPSSRPSNACCPVRWGRSRRSWSGVRCSVPWRPAGTPRADSGRPRPRSGERRCLEGARGFLERLATGSIRGRRGRTPSPRARPLLITPVARGRQSPRLGIHGARAPRPEDVLHSGGGGRPQGGREGRGASDREPLIDLESLAELP